MSGSTYLQAAFQAPTGGTIQFTYDPSGSPQTSDLVVAAGTIWTSQQAFIDEWMAQIVSDISAGFSAELTADVAGHNATVSVTTPGLNFSVEWSNSGDCDALRDWLGESSDISDVASGTSFASYAPGTFYSRWPAPRALRDQTVRPRSHRLFLEGGQQTQHSSAHGDIAEIDMTVELRFGTDPSETLTYTGYTQLERFIDNVLDADLGGIGRFTLNHLEAADDAPNQWVMRFREGELQVRPERVEGAPPDRAWKVTFPVVAMAVPW